MLRSLTLERFKSFEHARIDFGPLTTIVGPNASGKSNLRDALRFLHGVARGYSLAEIIGEKWGEGGVLQWRGIRGGVREVAFEDWGGFALEVALDAPHPYENHIVPVTYRIDIDVSFEAVGPQVEFESLASKTWRFRAIKQMASMSYLEFEIDGSSSSTKLIGARPAITQAVEHPDLYFEVGVFEIVRGSLKALSSMRFLDLSSDAMRLPSIPGQLVLGDRGENLSSVLQAICADEQQKRGLLEWLRELTPMDVVDLEFPADQTGRVLVTLVEESGRRVSAYSASDGTLRFLAMLAALLGPERAKFYFFEELENGLHPTRLALLLQLIEQQTAKGEVQVVATTHSPQLLNLLSPESRAHVYESYRLERSESTSLKRVMDLPDAERIVAQQGLGRLHESGWIEDAVAFTAPEPAE